jgi:hypothetical protein
VLGEGPVSLAQHRPKGANLTRMLVDPLRVRDANLVGCTGVTMEDGTVYRADRAGHLDIEDQGHVLAMLRHGEGFVAEQKFSAPRVAGTSCSGCGFDGFAFHASAPCPRCGGRMERT